MTLRKTELNFLSKKHLILGEINPTVAHLSISISADQMEHAPGFLGCYASFTMSHAGSAPDLTQQREEQSRLFRSYIWGPNGISKRLKILVSSDYGTDVNLILFEFYVNPLPVQLSSLKEVGSFRKKEKAIGLPVVVNEINFFGKSQSARYLFLKESILYKLELLKKKKLNLNIDRLKSDIANILVVE